MWPASSLQTNYLNNAMFLFKVGDILFPKHTYNNLGPILVLAEPVDKTWFQGYSLKMQKRVTCNKELYEWNFLHWVPEELS